MNSSEKLLKSEGKYDVEPGRVRARWGHWDDTVPLDRFDVAALKSNFVFGYDPDKAKKIKAATEAGKTASEIAQGHRTERGWSESNVYKYQKALKEAVTARNSGENPHVEYKQLEINTLKNVQIRTYTFEIPYVEWHLNAVPPCFIVHKGDKDIICHLDGRAISVDENGCAEAVQGLQYPLLTIWGRILKSGLEQRPLAVKCAVGGAAFVVGGFWASVMVGGPGEEAFLALCSVAGWWFNVGILSISVFAFIIYFLINMASGLTANLQKEATE